jgi:hypothetical protein
MKTAEPVRIEAIARDWVPCSGDLLGCVGSYQELTRFGESVAEGLDEPLGIQGGSDHGSMAIYFANASK